MSLPQLVQTAPRDRAEHPQVDSSPGHGAARERELLRRIHQHADPRARDELAQKMLPLARALAARYANRGEPLDDLVQVACIGLMKAIDGFDLTRDVRFSSYATPTVLGEIKRHFRDKTWAMRVPRGLQELQLRVAKARDKLTHELGRSPTVQEIATAIQTPFEEVLAAIQSISARRTRSLDEPTGEDVTLADSLGTVDPEIQRAEQRALIDGALHVLCDRDQEILRLRFQDDLSQDRDRPAHRRQPDAGLTTHQTSTRPRATADRAPRPHANHRRAPHPPQPLPPPPNLAVGNESALTAHQRLGNRQPVAPAGETHHPQEPSTPRRRRGACAAPRA